MLRRVLTFVDERSGLGAWLKEAAESPLPGGASWARSFGAVTLALIGLEALTGIALGAWYSPSVTDAWASVHYIEYQVFMGSLVRGLHHFGGNALIVMALLHFIQALVWGAYRAPRELTWVTGLLVLQVLIVISHTGYLLPNDLRAYWATQVLLGIAGNQPVVGAPAQTVIQGGPAFGNATLTHLYALHVLLLPAALALLLGVHLKLRKRHGAEAPPGAAQTDSTTIKRTPYWPTQAARDAAMTAATFVGLFVYTSANGGVELGAPGDPAVEYVARPEWYFLPIFQLRHWFTGSTEFIATAGLPGVAVGALCGLPFVYPRLQKKLPKAHALIVAGVLGGLVGAIGLGGMTAWADANDQKAIETNLKAEKIAHEAHRLAMIGVPVSGPLELYKNDPLVWGARVFLRECAACHSDCTEKPFKGVVCMNGYAGRAWLTTFLKDPHAPHYFGNTKIDEMDAFTGGDEKAKAIVEFVYSEGARTDVNAELAAKGRTLFDKEGCESCHTLDDEGSGTAPALKGYASEKWLEAFIRTPDAARFYGELNEMDSFPHEKLDKSELSAVIAYLRAQAAEPLNFAVTTP
ncbi:MAG: cytochrome b N-terminal domain-containing protein [Myxococcaceae bacterium]|nr:cytochrome b N-terminal domain-containing protein [Myxococcaceae bacterium]